MQKRMLLAGCASVAMLVFIPASALAGALLEADLGLHIFDVLGYNKLKYAAEDQDISESTDQDFTAKTHVPYGLFIAYTTDKIALGGELVFLSGKFKNRETDFGDLGTLEGDQTIFRFIRIGPQMRYFFLQEKLKPFVALTMAYVKSTLDPPNQYSQDLAHLDLGLAGGALYQLTERIALGGSGRFDAYLALDQAESRDVYFRGDKLTSTTTWMPFTLYFHAAATF